MLKQVLVQLFVMLVVTCYLLWKVILIWLVLQSLSRLLSCIMAFLGPLRLTFLHFRLNLTLKFSIIFFLLEIVGTSMKFKCLLMYFVTSIHTVKNTRRRILLLFLILFSLCFWFISLFPYVSAIFSGHGYSLIPLPNFFAMDFPSHSISAVKLMFPSQASFSAPLLNYYYTT